MNVTMMRGALILLTSAAIAATAAVPARAVTVGPIQKLGTGAWTWFSEPRAPQGHYGSYTTYTTEVRIAGLRQPADHSAGDGTG
ncbi:MAG TPA: hypothetical protein VHJ83_05550 [Micromonosporaceae bacterium]|nr:hypothetical protein [Micromonosporaceae bacterium]